MPKRSTPPWSGYLVAIAILAVVIQHPASVRAADDWPQFLGPTRDGQYQDGNLSSRWPADGPRTVWKRSVGQGFSGPVVSGKRLILFHRVADMETVECLEVSSGRTVWKHSYPATYRDSFGFEEGPRGTPAIHSGKVFSFGADGILSCLDFITGNERWTVDAKKQFGARKGFFGLAASPLVEAGRVILNIGGENGAGIVAFEADSGKLTWKATDHEAGYASPVMASVDGRRQALVFHRDGLTGVNPTDGSTLFEFPWRARIDASVNAATPLVIGDEVFLSASYDLGAVLLKLRGGGKPARWWSSDEALSNHYATSVYFEGHLYGFHGRQDMGRAAFRCVDWKTGKVLWSREEFGAGTLILAANNLLVMHEDGRLFQIEASPQRFKILQQAQALPSGVRAHTALADGLFFARSKDQLVCVDLRGDESK